MNYHDKIIQLDVVSVYWLQRHCAAIAAEADAEIARLREALAPFAEIAKHFDDGQSGLIHGWRSTRIGSAELTVEHVHAARAALAPVEVGNG